MCYELHEKNNILICLGVKTLLAFTEAQMYQEPWKYYSGKEFLKYRLRSTSGYVRLEVIPEEGKTEPVVVI